ncbi:MAG: sugar phosphate isomerase/epimerase [Nanoarchaeota archaeon]|nr:sugar phosphate isomerase/epimerase [Nanoarchaeota archaeon]MBU1321965.1 sugar phosphate isomerase/epimerase [Nanoarchaeota archaeon]MBU1597457.1 sugar phosphate isomerase/epimerase [Nanoarchaeota archaeon]MBU2442376.1 sugar phosphate isomerase/epimerase [Nanoarchaeota archaeon]
MIFNNYYSAMDRGYGTLEPSDSPSESGEAMMTSSLGPQEVGTSTNPMEHQVQSFAAKIRGGASKIELSFMGAGKSNAQQPSPEAFGSKDREDIRTLAEINAIKTSVHAPLHSQSLSGMGEQGFSDSARKMALSEIERAIHFAAEATKGGAVVFHTHEWQRPISEVQEKSGSNLFLGYPEERDKAMVMVADSKTGQINAVRKDHYVYEPKFHTAASYEKDFGKKLVGTIDPETGEKIKANDWINMNGGLIKKEWVLDEDKAEKLFDRVPIWNKEKTNFEVERVEYSDFIERAHQLEKETGKKIAPELLFFKTNTANDVLKAKGSSLFYSYRYENSKKSRDAAIKALEFYEQIESTVPEKEKWKLLIQQNYIRHDLAPAENMMPSEYLKDLIKTESDQMKHIHEASASADAQAQQLLENMNRIQTVEEFGKNKTAQTISEAGLIAMKYSDSHRKELNESIYVAPESWRTEQYGSHPDEIRAIITDSRKQMANQLVKEGYSKEEAARKSKEHIKATLDIGHFNLWRQHFVAKPGESPEHRDKRFNNWMLNTTEKLAKDGIVGHIHLTDNFGYHDEHLTPGEGNVPMKEFIKKMEEAGLKDFIAEVGSYNANTVMTDTWALMGSPIYTTAKAPTFRSIREQHLGYHNAAPYMVRPYAPSEDWSFWSEVPME